MEIIPFVPQYVNILIIIIVIKNKLLKSCSQ